MRNNKTLNVQQFVLLGALATLFWFGIPARAQNSVPPDQDTSRAQFAVFDRFLDSHPEIAEQLRKDPTLMKNDEFRENHPALQEFLQQHPGIREEFSENPNAFMRQEQRFDRRQDQRQDQRFDGREDQREDQRREDQSDDRREGQRGDARDGRDRDGDTTRTQLARMDRFLDSHPEIAEQLRKDPRLIRNDEFTKNHPALQEFLQQHPGIREEFSENPNAFMHQEQRFDRREDRREDWREDGRDRDSDVTHAQMAHMDQFLDSHPEIAEQLRKNPGLIKNDEFRENHPALREFLQQHPGVREEFAENPNAFMRQEQRYDRHEDNHDLSNFGEFLGGHSQIEQQLSHDPRLANSPQFLHSHPEFQEYLNAHPGVKDQLAQNPRAVMTGIQPFHSGTPTTDAGKTLNPDAKPAPVEKQKPQ